VSAFGDGYRAGYGNTVPSRLQAEIPEFMAGWRAGNAARMSEQIRSRQIRKKLDDAKNHDNRHGDD
jgi:hypothetical protein